MENHTEEHHEPFKIRDIPRLIRAICFLVILIMILFPLWRQFTKDSHKQKTATTIETSSRLEKTLRISELSTYQVTFNGVADIKDSNDKLLYHTAYKAKVAIGLDMDKIRVSVDEQDAENKKIIVSLPAVEITDVDIDPGSLDYIFEDSSANTDDVSITSLPACKADAAADCQSNELLFELAEENAENTIQALMRPFLMQNKEYTLEIIRS